MADYFGQCSHCPLGAIVQSPLELSRPVGRCRKRRKSTTAVYMPGPRRAKRALMTIKAIAVVHSRRQTNWPGPRSIPILLRMTDDCFDAPKLGAQSAVGGDVEIVRAICELVRPVLRTRANYPLTLNFLHLPSATDIAAAQQMRRAKTMRSQRQRLPMKLTMQIADSLLNNLSEHLFSPSSSAFILSPLLLSLVTAGRITAVIDRGHCWSAAIE